MIITCDYNVVKEESCNQELVYFYGLIPTLLSHELFLHLLFCSMWERGLECMSVSSGGSFCEVQTRKEKQNL